MTTTTRELFEIWKSNCRKITNDDSNKMKKRFQSIQQEATAFFTTLTNVTQVSVEQGHAVKQGEMNECISASVTTTSVLQTKPSHEHALALLMRTVLALCFEKNNDITDSTSSMIAALYCATGAIHACRTAGIALPLKETLSTFLLQLAGPLQIDNADNDGDEQIRDAAIRGLTVLLQCKTTPEKEKHNDKDSMNEQPHVEFTLRTAQSGVERRCAQPADEMIDDEEDIRHRQRTTTTSLLSLLPRSRRSMLFELLQAAVDSIDSEIMILTQQQQQIAAAQCCSNFAKFVASCLHGESDPRCLLQLLTLLDGTMTNFQRYFVGINFPVSDFLMRWHRTIRFVSLPHPMMCTV